MRDQKLGDIFVDVLCEILLTYHDIAKYQYSNEEVTTCGRY